MPQWINGRFDGIGRRNHGEPWEVLGRYFTCSCFFFSYSPRLRVWGWGYPSLDGDRLGITCSRECRAGSDAEVNPAVGVDPIDH